MLCYKALGDKTSNIDLRLSGFIRSVDHLPDHVLDLLEIASYVYCGDRRVDRGSPASLSYSAWRRHLRFVIRVRDPEFWNQPQVIETLQLALSWVSGDERYEFRFVGGHTTPCASLFDAPSDDEVVPTPRVALFSGGIDSLAGALKVLSTDDRGHLWLISHQSSPSAKKTQTALFDALRARFPDRVRHLSFECNLSGTRAAEETQRTRSFLFVSIAMAAALAAKSPAIEVYENGVTSINLPKRVGMDFARASRTTHPKTIALYQRLFNLITGDKVKIETPFLWLTKADVVDVLETCSAKDLLDSSVSCTRTFKKMSTTHCGGCSQCVDRRLSVAASACAGMDHSGIYANDFLSEEVSDPESLTFLLDYLAHSLGLSEMSPDEFANVYLSELCDLDGFADGHSGLVLIERVARLCVRHGKQVEAGLKNLRSSHEDLAQPVVHNSLFDLLGRRAHLEIPAEGIAAAICKLVDNQLPKLFAKVGPANENDLNDKLSVLLDSNRDRLTKECPLGTFALAKSVVDHGEFDKRVLYEAKFIRGGTTPSKASEGICADLVKYPTDSFKLFIVYDPDRAIADKKRYCEDLESKGWCRVLIVR